MEVEMVLQRIVVPCVGAIIGCALLASTDQGEDFYDDEPTTSMAFRTMLGALLSGIGLLASDLWVRGFLLNPNQIQNWSANYQWEWMVWSIPASMLLLAMVRCIFTVPNHHVAIAGTALSCLSVGVLFVALREGEVWQDQQAKILPWFSLGLVAMAANAYAMNALVSTGGSRWSPLVVMAQSGCVTALILQAYGTLGEWSLVGASAAMGAAVVSLTKSSSGKIHYGWPMSVVVQPLGLMAVANLVVSRFFESPSVPDWLLGSVLFLPSIAGIVDFLIGRLSNNAWFRALLAACLCSAVLGAIIYFAFPAKQDW